MDRRRFFECMLGGSALSIAALNELNAAVYDNIRSLNLQYQQSPDGVYWEAIRKHYAFKDKLIMMNNGTVGPMPTPVFNTLMKYFEVQLTSPVDCYTYLSGKRDETREKVAQYVNASPDEIAIVRNTTEGMNFIANGLDLKPGDEVLMSDLEHPGGIHPWRLKEKRYGIKVKEVHIGAPPRDVDEIVSAFEKAITGKTRVISISHTIFITGLIAPIKELSEMAHNKGIVVLADAAHGLGMLDLNMHDMGVDFWCTSPYKWFGAPPEAGVLYVRKDVQDKVWPTTASSGWDTHQSAKKFETLSQRADPLILALGEAVEFQKQIGKKRIARRIQTMSSFLREELGKIPRVRLHTNKDSYLAAGLTAFSIEGVDPQYMVDYLREKYNIVIRTIGSDAKGTRGVRVSTNIFVSLKNVETLLEGIHYLARTA
ncbi:aminotransferase class V-fold PLP-dependent enzyme [candidate division KSB1 bacterium]